MHRNHLFPFVPIWASSWIYFRPGKIALVQMPDKDPLPRTLVFGSVWTRSSCNDIEWELSWWLPVQTFCLCISSHMHTGVFRTQTIRNAHNSRKTFSTMQKGLHNWNTLVFEGNEKLWNCAGTTVPSVGTKWEEFERFSKPWDRISFTRQPVIKRKEHKEKTAVSKPIWWTGAETAVSKPIWWTGAESMFVWVPLHALPLGHCRTLTLWQWPMAFFRLVECWIF